MYYRQQHDKVDIRFVTTLRYLNVDLADGSYELMPGVYLVRGVFYKSKYLDDSFKRAAGIIEYDHFLNADHLVVCESDGSEFKNSSDVSLLLTIWLNWIDWLIQDSWLVRDNSMVCEIAYCRYSSGNAIQWGNNGLYAKMSTARGDCQKTVTFSERDISSWNELGGRVRSLIYKNGTTMGSIISDKSYSRFARFYYFVDISRRTHLAAVKIAHCCSALESLFSTDTVELSHRLSERVAFCWLVTAKMRRNNIGILRIVILFVRL